MAKKPNSNDILNEQGFILGNEEDCPKTARKIKAKESKFTEKIDVKKLKNTEPMKVDVQQTVKENVTTVVTGDTEQPAQLTIKTEKNEPAAEEISRERYTELEIQFVSLSIQYNNTTKAYKETFTNQPGYTSENAKEEATALLKTERLQKLYNYMLQRIDNKEGLDKVSATGEKQLLIEKNQPAGEKKICEENYTEQEIMFTSYIVQNKSNTDSLLLAYPEYKGQSLDYIQQRSSDLKMSPRIQRLLVRMREKAVRETERNLLWSFEDSVNALKSLVLTAQEEMMECKNDGQIKGQLNMPRVMAIRDAVKEINLMMGYTDKTTKINNTVVIKGSEADLPD